MLQYPEYTERLCRLIADRFRDEAIELVAGPTTGGVILAYEVARQLGVRSIYAEREGGARVFRRGLDIVPDERTLVVDDVLTTGGSVRSVVDEVRKRGGHVVGVAVLVDRSHGAVEVGGPLFSCHRASTPSYQPDECPLCKRGVPLVEPGRGQV